MQRKSITYLVPSIITLMVFFITKDFPFYWDNVIQISVPANFYFENNFSQFFLPSDIATGHPTFVGMYFAMMWKCFGRTLLVSHAAMMPFVFGLIYQILQLIKNLAIEKVGIFLGILVLVLLDTTFMSQLSLITFEIIQLSLFIFCLNQLIENRKIEFSIGFSLLMLISLRGALIGLGLLLSYLIITYKEKKFEIKKYFEFIPGLICLSGFLFFFYISNGWIIHNTVSNNWDTANEFASFQTILKNIAVTGWQLLDYGRIVIFGFLIFIIYQQVKTKKFEDEHLRFLFIIGMGQIVVIAPILIFSQIQFGHRYFLPTIIPLAFFVGYWLLNHWGNKYKKMFFGAVVLILASGHIWVYPKKISQGWDSTTMHWQYFKVADQMYDYVVENNIDTKEIGTFFPAYKSRRFTHLEEQDGKYEKFDDSQPYLLYSNAFNVADEIIDVIEQDGGIWEKENSFTSMGVEITLYRRKK